jgi:RNA polymerase sigma-70 factor (sigma-E family)
VAADALPHYAPAEPRLDAMYRREYPSLCRLAVILVGSTQVAEELVQEAFVAAHRRWGEVQAMDIPEAWVRRVVLNKASSWRRRRRLELKWLARHRPPVSAAAPDLDGAVWLAIRKLPRRQAQAIVLILVEDRSASETAELMGCDESTVRTHLRRGRAALAKELGVNEVDQP